MTNEYILAIETSCDETAAAIIRDGKTIVSNIVASQMDSHSRFGGVVPEVASRHHVEQVTMVIQQALEEAQVTPKQLTAVAVTEGPGLVGALLVGIQAAKTFAFCHQLPLINVHHIAGHIYAAQLSEPLTFPLIALIVSGGHTELIYMKEHGSFETIGQTRDDAAGEAYDKVARVVGLPYPGGPEIDRLAAVGEANIPLPRAWLEEGSLDFSFSGLKSAVLNAWHNAKQRGETIDAADMAASFQASVIEVIVAKTKEAVKQTNARQLIVAGGVASNKGLRAAIQSEFNQSEVVVTIPPSAFCTDNAAMIGAAASMAWARGIRAPLSLNARPSYPLSQWLSGENNS
ncbi:tRNA (adenosine(37)-N6)-threonylcarbamoyltransferase complex transferase subunit TsaD [Aureibacillus halotolerans]|uniref:tRNA N6-adenosine threonylcarbamoyltransferase n=1 Tax=Aureibacillus halotolerans TaxID=1508390 RepID=A0A4R6TUW8_9BACI|nr:tRNA (adenosine(37)-N6)-threonylcarbamoyltransferase complex transferase subunit TsaD [Aureibacillus halotolerans]TDQ35220.1 O-sialoglycoprotein endopeptidase [Aureibacillus halotolerans]